MALIDLSSDTPGFDDVYRTDPPAPRATPAADPNPWDVPTPPAAPQPYTPPTPSPSINVPTPPTAPQQRPPGAPVTPGPSPYAAQPWYQQIVAAYRQYTGRDPSEAEVLSHVGGGRLTAPQNVNWAIGNIRDGLEARAYAQRQTTPQTPQTTPTNTLAPGQYTATLPGFDSSRLNNAADGDPKTVWARYAYSVTNGGARPLTADDVRRFVAQDPRWELGGSATDPYIRVKQDVLNTWKPGTSIWQDVIRDSGGAGGIQFNNVIGDPAQGYAAAGPAAGTGAAGAGSGVPGAAAGQGPAPVARDPSTLAPGTAGNSVFSDPATQEWETLLRSVVDRLNQPQTNPDFQPLVDYMRKYMGELQGAPYTPAESELLQTQALDPMTQERDAARQQIIQHFAARGQGPESGPVQKALLDLESQYRQQRTKTQAGFATNAINLERQNKETAAQIGTALAALQQQQFAGNESRATQAVNLFSQIPGLADKRLQEAIRTLAAANQNSAAGLFSSLPAFQNAQTQQTTQDQNYWASIGSIVSSIIANL